MKEALVFATAMVALTMIIMLFCLGLSQAI